MMSRARFLAVAVAVAMVAGVTPRDAAAGDGQVSVTASIGSMSIAANDLAPPGSMIDLADQAISETNLYTMPMTLTAATSGVAPTDGADARREVGERYARGTEPRLTDTFTGDASRSRRRPR